MKDHVLAHSKKKCISSSVHDVPDPVTVAMGELHGQQADVHLQEEEGLAAGHLVPGNAAQNSHLSTLNI